MTKQDLFSEFSSNSAQEWIEKITKDLKGADFDKKMISKTLDGLEIKPFYRKEDLESITSEISTKFENNWEVCQEIFSGSVQKAKEKIVDAINNEVDRLGIQSYYEDNKLKGIQIQNQTDFENLMEGISKDISVDIRGGLQGLFLLKFLVENIEKNQNWNCHSSVDFDPILEFFKGHTNQEILQLLLKEVSLNIQNLNKFKNLKIIGIHSSLFQNSGAPEAYELAYTLALANEYLTYLSNEGISIKEILSKMKFHISTGPNYFREIAKLRALRLLWNEIVRVHDESIEETYTAISSQSSIYNLTSYDPEVNFLRTTTEAMSSILGGADEVSLMPYDLINEADSDLGSRMTRNIQYVLRDESYLGKVADPAGGSFYLESLTQDLANKALEIFQKIEKEGGLIEYFNKGLLKKELEEFNSNRLKNIENRKEILLGVNQFPLQGESSKRSVQSSVKLDFESEKASSLERYLGGIVNLNIHEESIGSFRSADPFEKLRLKTEKSGKTVKVALILFGNRSMASARSNFSSNFFGCAGFDIHQKPRFDDIQEASAWIKELDPQIIVFCAGDDDYSQSVPGFIEQNKLNNSMVIAGNPKEGREKLEKAGIEEFIHVKSNVYESLVKFQEKLLR